MKNSNPEKVPFYKKKWFAAIVVLILIGAIFGPKDKDKKETPEPAKVEEKQEEVKKENKEKPKEEAKEEPKEENKELSNDDKKAVVEALIKGQFAEFFDTKTETKDGIFYINLYPKGDLVNDITFLLTNPDNQEIKNSWKGVTDMLVNITKQARENIDEEVSLNVYNPLNKKNIIYSNVSGAEFYNVINDLNK